jgi:nitrate reductase NapE component
MQQDIFQTGHIAVMDKSKAQRKRFIPQILVYALCVFPILHSDASKYIGIYGMHPMS